MNRRVLKIISLVLVSWCVLLVGCEKEDNQVSAVQQNIYVDVPHPETYTFDNANVSKAEETVGSIYTEEIDVNVKVIDNGDSDNDEVVTTSDEDDMFDYESEETSEEESSEVETSDKDDEVETESNSKSYDSEDTEYETFTFTEADVAD